MSSQPDLGAHFAAMEALVEAQPEGVNAEIARGVYLMSPWPGIRYSFVQGRLLSLLHEKFGRGEGSSSPDWLFAFKPEIRSETAFSRLIPDVAGWSRSTSGWPDPEVNPILLPPEWAAEVLSPATKEFDRGPKQDAYGLMGVGWLWLLDVEKRTVETFANVRGKMVAGPSFAVGQTISAPPFPALSSRVEELFLPQEAAEKWIRDNPNHPGLRFKRIHSSDPIYSVRVGMGYRPVGVFEGDVMVWFWIGTHADYDGLLSKR